MKHNDFSQKTKVILFGTGNWSTKLTKEFEEWNYPFEIVAYMNDVPNSQGATFFGKRVIHPNEMAAYDFEQIIIAAIDSYTIYNKLTKFYGIAPELINQSLAASVGTNKARVLALQSAVGIIADRGIPGAAAELGVYQGDFAKHINAFLPERSLYLFDTFQGFDEQDVQKEKKLGFEKSFSRTWDFSATNEDLVLQKMQHPEMCILKKGFFPETAKGLDENFAFVSLDCDLYQPMLEGLNYFYQRLSPGGYIFVHDYFNQQFLGAKEAVLEFQRTKGIGYTPIGDDCSVVITK